MTDCTPEQLIEILKTICSVDATGDKIWYLNGQPHRIDGPAIELANGDKFWCQNGKIHRVDGPAIEYSNGIKFWYLNGKEYTEEEFNNELHTRTTD